MKKENDKIKKELQAEKYAIDEVEAGVFSSGIGICFFVVVFHNRISMKYWRIILSFSLICEGCTICKLCIMEVITLCYSCRNLGLGNEPNFGEDKRKGN